MDRLHGVTKNHDWGSPDLIPAYLNVDSDGRPWAEEWFGAHPGGPAKLERGSDLAEWITAEPMQTLGASTQFMFGPSLPYLVKLIAPARALSLQVHPNRTQAAAGFVSEERQGPALSDPTRTYLDSSHKPEMLYAISDYDALVGFAVRRQVRERLDGLDCPLASRLSRRLRLATGRGIKPVVSWILDPEDGPKAQEIGDFAQACFERTNAGLSPDDGIDSAIVSLQEQYPGEAGIALAFLMNHLTLKPGTAVFVPPGTVHSYQRGLALEVMANSDNVIRAGLTSKHVDRALFMETAVFDGIPPTLIAPEHPLPGVDRFRSPVEDFELSVATPDTSGAPRPLPMRETGPRILVGLSGQVLAQTRTGEALIRQGEAVFVPDSDGPILLSGDGKVAQVSVP